MVMRRPSALLMVVAAWALAGCSVLLDPDNCSSDDECNGGICQGGICLGGGEPAVDMADAAREMEVDPPDVAVDMAPDVTVDMTPDVAVDMAPDVPPPDPLAPTCGLTASPEGQAPTTVDMVELTAQIADPDTPIERLMATLDGEQIALEGESTALTRGLDEGPNRFRLRVVDPDGLDCEAEVTVVRDTTAPVIEGSTPRDGADLLVPNAEFPISGRVVDAHFTVEGPARLEVRLDGDLIEPEVAWDEAQGYAFVVVLEEGRSELELVAIDDLGHTSDPVGFAVRLDETPPIVIVDAPPVDAEVFEDRIEVRGRIEDDRQPVAGGSYRIRVTSEAGDPVAVQGPADGAGAFARRVPLVEGLNTITVTGQDLAGNEGEVVRRVTRLPAEPCIAITSPEAGAFTRDARVEVAGDVCPAVERVEVRVGDGPPVVAEPADARFGAEVVLAGAGSYTLTATAFVGELEASDSVELVLDDSPPAVSISQPGEGQCTNARDIEVRGRVSDAQSGIESLSIFVGDAENVVELPDVGGPFRRVVPLGDDERVPIVAAARNGALARAEARVEILVDREAPMVCITRRGACAGGGLGPWYGLDEVGRVQFAGLADWGTCPVSRLTVDGLAVNVGMDGRFSTARPFDDGPHDIALVVEDTAGNSADVPFIFRVDGTPPTLDAVTPEEGAFTTEAEVRLELEVSDEGSGLVSILIGGQSVFDAPDGGVEGSPAEVVARRVPLEEGLNTIEIEAVDFVGNRLVRTVQLYRDTQPPTVEVLAPAEGRPAPVPIVVAGTIDDGPLGSGPARVMVNGVEAVVDLEAGTWRVDGLALDPAEPSVTVEAQDAVGNALDPARVVPVTVSEFGSNPPEVDGLDFDGLVGWSGVIDVDLDGRLDVVALGGAPDVESKVFVQAEPGRFEVRGAADVGLPEGMEVRHAAVADLDADGTHDMVIVGVGRTAVVLGNGAGGFRLVENARLLGADDPTGIALGDITRNARLDLIVMAGAATRLYLSAGDGTFDREPLDSFGLSSLVQYRASRLVDVDGDGVLDLIAVGPDGAALWLRERDGLFVPAPGGLGFASAAADAILAVDADGDAALDLLTVGGGAGRFMLADGDGGFVQDPVGLLGWPADVAALERLDFDGDTRDDLVSWGDRLRLYRASPDGYAQIDAVAAGAAAPDGPPITSLTAADIDRDGDDDLLLGGPAGVRFVRNNRAATDPAYGFVGLDVRRAVRPPEGIGPRDAWGPRVDVDLVGGDQGLPERTLLARPIGPTIVTTGPAAEIGVAVYFIDLGGPGRRIANEPRLTVGDFFDIFALEAAD